MRTKLPSGPDLPVRVPQTGDDTTEADDSEPSQEYLDAFDEYLAAAMVEVRARRKDED